MPERGPEATSQIWSGSISFGLVNVPVALVGATRDHDYRFREIHEPDRSPVARRRFCSEEGVEVEREEIGRGYELGDGGMVVLTEEDLDSVAPERTRTIEIESFADLAEVEPILFDRSYFAVPTGKGEGDRRAYRLLAEAMAASGQAGIGRFVLRTREYLVAIREVGGVLALTTLLFPADVRPAEEVPTGEGEAPERLVEEAVAVIEELSGEWQPEEYEDRYRDRLKAVIEDKRKGRAIEAPETADEVAERPTAAPDLMAALKRTLEEAKGGGRSRRGARAGGSGSRDKGGDRKRLDRLSRDQLYERAQQIGLSGRSRMSKDELRKALSKR